MDDRPNYTCRRRPKRPLDINYDQLQAYGAWHDRAAFHFLLEDHDIQSYVNQVNTHLKPSPKPCFKNKVDGLLSYHMACK